MYLGACVYVYVRVCASVYACAKTAIIAVARAIAIVRKQFPHKFNCVRRSRTVGPIGILRCVTAYLFNKSSCQCMLAINACLCVCMYMWVYVYVGVSMYVRAVEFACV